MSTTKAGIDKIEDFVAGKPVSPAEIGAASGPGLAGALAARAGISGPVQCVSLACASGLAAVERAANLLLGDRADAVFVVGADILSKFVVSGFNALKSIDPDGCRPFDARRRGLSPGEAGAALLLVRDGPRAPGPAIAGWGTSNDANHLTGPSRDGKGLALAIERALAGAGVAPAGIGYIHGHGTGTVYNDSMESLALKTVFGESMPPVSSTKRITGHTMGAAGLVETVICLAAAETRLLPGTAGLENPAADAPGSILGAPAELERAPAHILKINSGFGGVNAALAIRTGAGQ